MSENEIPISELIRKYEDEVLLCSNECTSLLNTKKPDDLEVLIDSIDTWRDKYVIRMSKEIYYFLDKRGQELSSDDFSKLFAQAQQPINMFQELNIHVAKLVARNNKIVLRRTKEGFLNQLSAFSMVLAMLTFILSNVKLFTENLSFSVIMASNISYILMCVIMFSLIYYFIHLDDDENKSKSRIAHFTIVIAILCILIFALVCISQGSTQQISATLSSQSTTITPITQPPQSTSIANSPLPSVTLTIGPASTP